MGKSSLYRGAGVFSKNFPWQLQKCDGIPKLLTNIEASSSSETAKLGKGTLGNRA